MEIKFQNIGTSTRANNLSRHVDTVNDLSPTPTQNINCSSFSNNVT